jgi:ribonuclease HI
MITIFTDGSSRGNPGPGGWGAIVSYKQIVDSSEGGWVKELGGRVDHTTNNRMELTACIKALEFVSTLPVENRTAVRLHTDSEYIVKGITVWVKGWQANNWRTAAKKPVLNQDLWQELLAVSEGKEITWSLVRGHAGVAANERCDEIATLFADMELPFLYDGPRTDYAVSLHLHEGHH